LLASVMASQGPPVTFVPGALEEGCQRSGVVLPSRRAHRGPPGRPLSQRAAYVGAREPPHAVPTASEGTEHRPRFGTTGPTRFRSGWRAPRPRHPLADHDRDQRGSSQGDCSSGRSWCAQAVCCGGPMGEMYVHGYHPREERAPGRALVELLHRGARYPAGTTVRRSRLWRRRLDGFGRRW